MNISKIIFFKLILPILPVGLLAILGTLSGQFNSKQSLWLLLIYGILVYYLNDVNKHILAFHNRKEQLSNPEFRIPPEILNSPKKINALNCRISLNGKTIDVLSNNKIILYLTKEHQKLELYRLFYKNTIKFNEVDYLILDSNVFKRFSFLEGWVQDPILPMKIKTSMSNNISAKLKNGKTVTLLKTKIYDNIYPYEDIENYENATIDLERICLENGKKIIKIMSHYMHKKYIILDNRA